MNTLFIKKLLIYSFVFGTIINIFCLPNYFSLLVRELISVYITEDTKYKIHQNIGTERKRLDRGQVPGRAPRAPRAGRRARAKDRTDFDWVQSRSKKKNGAGSRADFKILPFSQFYAVFMPFSCR